MAMIIGFEASLIGYHEQVTVNGLLNHSHFGIDEPAGIEACLTVGINRHGHMIGRVFGAEESVLVNGFDAAISLEVLYVK